MVHTFCVKPLTPVHIGDGTEIIPLEYIKENGKLKVFNFEKVVKAAKSGFLVKRILEEVRSGSSLADIFNKNYVSEVLPEYSIDARKHAVKNQSIKSFIKSMNRVYIPGSEIKGAIRTALAYSILKREENLQREAMEILKNLNKELKRAGNNRRDRTKSIRRAGNKLETLIFRNCLVRETDAKSDLLKALIVSDTYYYNPSEVLMLEKNRIVGSNRKIEEFLEVLKPDVKFEGLRIEVCETILKSLQYKFSFGNKYADVLSFRNIRKSVAEFYSDLIDVEIDYFSQKLEGKPVAKLRQIKNLINTGRFILRIGKHQGFLSATVMLFLRNADFYLYEELYKKTVPKPRNVVNKTRNVSSNGEPFGWIELEQNLCR